MANQQDAHYFDDDSDSNHDVNNEFSSTEVDSLSSSSSSDEFDRNAHYKVERRPLMERAERRLRRQRVSRQRLARHQARDQQAESRDPPIQQQVPTSQVPTD